MYSKFFNLQCFKLPALLLTGMMGMVSGVNAQTLSLAAQVGEKLFFDTNLSSSGQMACSTCHDPNNHYAQPVSNTLAVQLGGPNLKLPGSRPVPTLTYKDNNPPYSDLATNPDGVSTNAPGGGFFWDGRVDTLADQAAAVLLNPVEMDNGSQANVVSKVQAASYASLFIEAYGSNAFADTTTAFNNITVALQAYQLEDTSFHPYSSKYDLYIGNKIGGNLTASEANGLAVFMDPNRGNCNACHFAGAGFNGSVGLFTDFSYEAIGLPRNTTGIPGNKSLLGLATSYDMGLCSRSDHPMPASSQYCGMFKTPTLRNVATRNVFFHNGQFKTLSDVLNFYNTRDTSPQNSYPTVNGVVQKFNDLPSRYHGNIDTQMPLDGRAPGSSTPMTAQELLDLEAFLNTLTDGYVAP
ncbi:MAG: cytochrome c peroxidase [Methylococcales bacterium]|nr:cytochrome c peroxidase [Methylococcales bacterium]